MTTAFALQLDSLNNCHKKAHKIRCSHSVTCLMFTIIYDHNSRLNCHHKLLVDGKIYLYIASYIQNPLKTKQLWVLATSLFYIHFFLYKEIFLKLWNMTAGEFALTDKLLFKKTTGYYCSTNISILSYSYINQGISKHNLPHSSLYSNITECTLTSNR